MRNELEPIVGQWYRHRDKGQPFQVVAIDEDAGTVEMQLFDGDLEEVELAAWRRLGIELAAEPEDWTGPVDDVEPDDLGYSDDGAEHSGWHEPYESVLDSVAPDLGGDDDDQDLGDGRRRRRR